MADVKRFLRYLLFFVFVAAPLLLVLSGAAFWFLLDGTYGDAKQTVVFEVPKGANITGVSSSLHEEHLVKNSWYIRKRYWILDKLGMVPDLKAGRYLLGYGSRPSELIRTLTSPTNDQKVYEKLLIKPGSTVSEIALAVENGGFAQASDVRDAVRYLAEDYPILDTGYGLQGYLFPDTYNLESPLARDAETSRINAEMIVRIMADRFFETLDEIDPNWKNLTTVQLHEKVTLASIVEREYRVDFEAPLIAAVFNNRLSTPMRLQSCATLVYALMETPEGQKFKDEYLRNNRRILNIYTTDVDSPFNTYQSDSLPPSPIAVPGRVALEAAFFPGDTDALFFVVEYPGANTHVFTRDYADHEKAAEAYLSQFQVKD